MCQETLLWPACSEPSNQCRGAAYLPTRSEEFIVRRFDLRYLLSHLLFLFLIALTTTIDFLANSSKETSQTWLPWATVEVWQTDWTRSGVQITWTSSSASLKLLLALALPRKPIESLYPSLGLHYWEYLFSSAEQCQYAFAHGFEHLRARPSTHWPAYWRGLELD